MHDSATNTEYRLPVLPIAPGATAGSGAAVGYAEKYIGGTDLGVRAVRWDASGTGVTELGHLGTSSSGVASSRANAVNTAGTAVGLAVMYSGGIPLGGRAVRWDAASTDATELGQLGTSSSGAAVSEGFAINKAGTAVGYARKYIGNANLGDRAVRWDASGTAVTELGNLGTSSNGVTSSYAIAINNTGTAVGYATKYDDGSNRGDRAVRWDASSTAVIELGNLGTSFSGQTTSRAISVNSAGMAVGWAHKYGGYSGHDHFGSRAVRWDASGTVATELGHLGMSIFDFTSSSAYAVNTAGTAVGYANKYSGTTYLNKRAVRWDALSTAATELGNLGTSSSGVTISSSYAINMAGTVVGYARKYSDGVFLGDRAVAWGPDGVAIDLNTLLSATDTAMWTLTTARDISDTHWVTGYGNFDPDGAGGVVAYPRMFLLDVIRHFGKQGDSTRDNVVNFDDLLILAQHYGQTSGARWDDGDFSGDGAVGFDDLLTLAQNYNGLANISGDGLSADFSADWALAVSLVPEPASLTCLALGSLSLVRRRRRAVRSMP